MTMIGASESLTDLFLVFQVDENPPMRVAGFTESLAEEGLTLFIGLDRRGNPAATTERLMYEMLKGHHLYLLDPETHEPLEHWSMTGSIKAVKLLHEMCDQEADPAKRSA